jgi:hypothetical protein
LEKLICKFNNLPRDARCNWHDEALLSTTESRKSPAALSHIISHQACHALALPAPSGMIGFRIEEFAYRGAHRRNAGVTASLGLT